MQTADASNSIRSIRVAAVQTLSENGRIAANLDHATPLVEQAAHQGAQIVLLPEFMSTGYFLGDDIWDAGEPAAGSTVQWLKDNSKRLGIWLGASFLEADGQDFFNTFVLADSLGNVAGRVRKQTPAIWEAYFFKGESGTHAIETSLGKVGVAICFDSQIADVAVRLSNQSVDIVLLPHSFPVPLSSSGMFNSERMISHLKMIAPLHASLLGVPVVLANKCGPWQSPIPGPQLVKMTNCRFPGLSTIIDGDGSVKASLDDNEGVIVADVTIDPSHKKQPVVPHYGRYVYPGPAGRSVLRLVEAMGRLHYQRSSRRKTKAQSLSSQG